MNLQYQFERIFEQHFEFHARDGYGLVQDKIYRGMFEKTLLDKGFTKNELKEGVEKGWLQERFIQPEPSGGYRSAYIWLLEEMPQRNWIKQQIDKVRRWMSSDYDRYYGAR